MFDLKEEEPPQHAKRLMYDLKEEEPPQLAKRLTFFFVEHKPGRGTWVNEILRIP